MPKKAIDVVIKGEYTDRDIQRAIRDLDRLKTQGGATAGAFGAFGNSLKAFGAGLVASIGFGEIINGLKDSAQAAMEDEKSMVALATAMDNVGLSAKNAEAEGLINSMSLQSGIADDRLRPAYQKLVTATKDVTEAQGLLQTAMDLSAAGYGDLESASKALSSAAMGNFTALQRLKVPIDANIIKSRDFDAAMQSLNKTVGGQAAAAAETYQGKMDRLTVSVNEAKEAIGYALLNALDDVSEAFGGVGGAQGAIQGFGQATANFVTGVGVAVTAMARLTAEMVDGKEAGTNWGDVVRNIGLAAGVTFPPFMLLVGAIEQITDFGDRYSRSQADAAKATRGLTSATVAAGIAMGNTRPAVNDLTEEVQKSGMAAYTSAQSFQAFWTAAANLSNQQSIMRQLMNTSGTVGAELFKKAQEDLAKAADVTTRKLDGLKTSSGGAASATKELTAAQQAAADRAKALQQNTDSLATSLQGLITEMTPVIASAATATFDTVNAQVEKFKSMFTEAKQYAQGMVDSFMGGLDLGAALTKAKESGKSIVEAFVDQGKGIVEFGRLMKSLLDQNLSRAAYDDIISLGYERGMDVAKALAEGNVAGNIASVNEVYGSVKTMAEQVAEAAASAFYDAGLKSIMELVRAMVEALSLDGKGYKKIMKVLDDLSASMYRKSYIDVEVRGPYGGSELSAAMASYSGPTFSPDNPLDLSRIGEGVVIGLPGFAEGGIATRPTPGIFGEAGTEALIPLDRMGDFGGGNTYQITVQTGVGDPRQIGEQVVSYIKRFEAASGPVFARA
jgi:hypothetical protein